MHRASLNSSLWRRARFAAMAAVALALLAGRPAGATAAPAGERPSDVVAVVAAAGRYQSGASTAPLRQIETWVAAATDDAALRRELEKELASLLMSETATYEARRFACSQLAVIGAEGCLPALARLLRNEAMVDIACLALANIPHERAGEVLRNAVANAQGNARAQVLKTLGTRRDAAAVPLLARAVAEDDPAVVGAAIAALGRIANPAALGVLAGLRADARASVAGAAREATLVAAERLAETGKRGQAEGLFVELLAPEVAPGLRCGALTGLLRLDSDGGVARIAEVLNTQDAALKPVAIAHIARLEARVATRKFAAWLPGLAPADQVLLIAALAERGDPAARPAVAGLLGSPDGAVRWAAAEALGSLGDASNVPALCRFLADAATPAEGRRIEWVLSRLAGGETVDRALMTWLRDRKAAPKAPVLSALVRRGSRVAMPLLRVEAGSEDPALARLAFQGLSRLAVPEDLPDLLEALGGLRAAAVEDEAAANVARALERLVPPERRSALIRTALGRTAAPEVRSRYVRLLPAGADGPGLAAVEAALTDTGTRAAALQALADWPDRAAWDGLFKLYETSGGGLTGGERAGVLRGLVRLAGEEAAQRPAEGIERYRRLLAAATSDADRKAILGGLGACPDVGALQLAVEQLGNAGVRAEAAAAVRSIAEAIRASEPAAAQAALDRLK
jgi:HEAT repeat protein